MQITECEFYDGAKRKIERLGLKPLLEEAYQALRECRVLLLEEKNANGAALLRKYIDNCFQIKTGWRKISSGGVDWGKCLQTDKTSVCIGIEIQVSARSDLVIRDIVHLRDALEEGAIDLGILVVPSDKLSLYLNDRGPTLNETRRVIEKDARVTQLPLVIITVEHDGPGPALPKQKRRR